MNATLSTRKPVDKITLADLRSFPIWEFASDEENQPGQDETWIKPVQAKAVPIGAYSQLVAASFVAGPTSILMGFMVVTTAQTSIKLSPGAIVTLGAYHFIPSSNKSGAERERAALTKLLGISFPVSYRLLVPIAGEQSPREGIVN